MTKIPAALTIQYRKKGEGSLELARIIAAIGQSHNASYHGTAGSKPILLSLGSLPWSAWGLSSVSEVATYAGQAIFYYMPYLFAVGVAWGLSNQAGTAGLAALAGMFTYDRIVTQMGDGLVQPATLIGILLGIVAGVAQNRFKNIKLPEAIQFLEGRVLFCCSWACFLPGSHG